MKPEFTGGPLAYMIPVPKSKEFLPEGPQLWMWSSFWYQRQKDTISEEQLTANGYERTDFGGAVETQLYETVRRETGEYWYKPEGKPAQPVVLCFATYADITPLPPFIPMLTPVPLPGLGEYALIPHNEKEELVLLKLKKLPPEAQKRWKSLAEAIIALTAPAQWELFIEAHRRVLHYEQELQLLEEQARIAPNKTKQEHLQKIALFIAARTQMEEVRASLNKPDWEQRWREIQIMTQDLAGDYMDYFQQQSLAAIFPPPTTRAKPKRPSAPLNFNEQGYAAIVAASPFQALVNSVNNAISGATKWNFDGNTPPSFTYAKPGGTTIVSYQGPEQIQPDNKTTQRLWNELKTFDEQATDVILDLFSHLSRNLDDGAAWFFASAHLDHRSIVPMMKTDTASGRKRRAGYRREDVAPIGATLSRLENIWLIISQQIEDPSEPQDGKPKRKRRGKKLYTHTGRLLMVDQRWYQNELSGEEGPGAGQYGYAIGWHIRPGDWLKTFLEAPNLQVSRLCKTLLEYDPVRRRWEKRIGQYVMFHGHMQTRGKAGVLTRRIRDLLEETSIAVDERNPQRSKDRFEQAMTKLAEDHVIDGWKYKEQMNLPAHRWISAWLDQYVSIFIAPAQGQIEAGGNQE